MRIEELAKFIAALPVDQTVLLLGPPGIGKSATGLLVAEYMRPNKFIDPETNEEITEPVKTVVWDLGCKLPEDIGGLPFRDGDATFYAPPVEVIQLCERDVPGVLLLDDLTLTLQAVQTAVAAIVYEKRVGSVHLSDKVRVIATGNRREDKSNATVLPAMLRNRMMILPFEPNLDGWVKYYIKQKDAQDEPLPFDVPAFLAFKPEYFSQLPKDASENGAFATPRQWVALGRCLKAAQDAGMVLEAAEGLVGNVGGEFKAFLEVRKDIPDPEAILMNPQGTVPEVPDRIDVLVSMLTMIAAKAAKYRKKDADEMPKRFMRAVAYLSRPHREYCGVAVDAFASAGGRVDRLTEYIRTEGINDPDVKAMLSHIQAAVLA